MTPNVCTLRPVLTSREFCSHHRRQPDSTKQFCRVGVGGVKWVLGGFAVASLQRWPLNVLQHSAGKTACLKSLAVT